MSIQQCLQGCLALLKNSILLLLLPLFSHAQVRLNEVSGDTGNNDSTNDGIVELAGAAGTDIGCYVISNSEWTVVLPPNTKIPANGVFLIACSEGKNIGSNPNPVVGSGLTCALCDFPNMPINFDVCNPTNAAYIDWAASGFTIDNAAGTDGDQIVLFSPAGKVLDAVQWGEGSTNIPTDNTTLAASRGNQNYTIGDPTWNGEGNAALPPNALKSGGTCYQSGIKYTLPAISSGKYTDLTNLPFIKSINAEVQKGCNSSFMFDEITNKWIKTDHPNPGFPTHTPYDNFTITGNLNQCSNALAPITVTWKVLNWQSVEESTVNDFGRIGSFWQEEGTGISNTWTSVLRDNVTGITTLQYSFTPTTSTTYNFVWQDRVEHTIASSENGSGLIGAVTSGSTLSDCYETKALTVKVADPMVATKSTIICPTDNPAGNINFNNFVTGGIDLSYKLMSNNVEISTNTSGVFSLPTSLATPISVVISDASGCNLPVTISVDAGCRQAPVCPIGIVTTKSTPSGAACVESEISLCMSALNLPSGGAVSWYYSTTSATFAPTAGTLIGSTDIPTPTTATTADHPGGGTCPIVQGIMVDACNGTTAEKDNEFLILRNGSTALNVDDLDINLPSSIDIKMTVNDEFVPYTGANSPSGSCFTVLDDGATIPADGVVVIFMSNSVSQTYDFNALCTAYGSVYLLFRKTAGAPVFSNAAKVARNTILSVKNNTACKATYTYQNPTKPSSGTTDGTFYRFPLPLAGKVTSATPLNNGCSAPPVTAAPATPPCVNFTIPAALCGISNLYIRPIIHPVDASCPSGSNTTAALTYNLSCPKAKITGNMTTCAPNTGNATISVTNGNINSNISGKIVNNEMATTFTGQTDASGNATIIVNGLKTGDYLLSEMTISGSNCEVQFSGTASIIVNAVPKVTFTNVTPNVCQGLLAEIPIITAGMLPFDLIYTLNGGTPTKIAVFSNTLYIPIPSGISGLVSVNVTSVTDDNGCVGTVSGAATINIIAPPNAPTGENSENCWQNGTTDLIFTAKEGVNTIHWYDMPVGGAVLGTGNELKIVGFTPTAPFPKTITRYAATLDAATGCISTTRTPVNTIIQQKIALSLTKTDPTCAAPSAGKIKITANPVDGTYNYDKADTFSVGALASNKNITASAALSNLKGGDYTVRAFTTNTCFSDNSIKIPAPTGCFTCPNIGNLSGLSAICQGKTLTLTASNLTNMAMASNGASDFGIQFVYFTTQQSGNTMYGTPDGVLGAVSFAQITAGKAILNNAALPLNTGNYYLYALLDPIANVDLNCRPFKEIVVKVNPLPAVNNASLTLCEDVFGTGKAVFTLSEAKKNISSENITINYYALLSDAQANTSALSNTYHSIAKKTFARVVESSTGCINFAELQLNVAPRPSAGIAPPKIAICANGKPINLFDILTGKPDKIGIWSGASALSGGNLGTCDPTKNASGIYIYTVKGTPPCTDATATVEVQIMPTSLACASNITLSLDAKGEAKITPEMVVHGNYTDYSLLKVEVFDKNGTLLPNATATTAQLGTTLHIAVTNTCSNGICNTTALLEDKTKSICATLKNYTLPCTVDLATTKPAPSDFTIEPLDADSVRQDRSTYSKDFTGLYVFKGEVNPKKVKISVVSGSSDDVIFTDNTGIASIFFVDVVQDYGCVGKPGNPSILKEITRQWRLVDIYGNGQNCSQVISIQAITNIGCPIDVTLECDEADLALKLKPEGGENKAGDKVQGTGAPFMDSNGNGVKNTTREPYIYPENKAMTCKFTAKYTDKRYEICKNSYKIIRTWVIFNECDKTISTCRQTIAVLDTKAPDITADEKNKILEVTANECAYMGALKFFNVTDKSGVKRDEIRISIKNKTTGKTENYLNYPDSHLPRGVYEITVIAKDSCENIATKTFERTVLDRQAPTMFCQDNIKISLNGLSLTNICAKTFDHASRDNCSELQLKVAKSNSQTLDVQKLTYTDCLSFSCTEVGKPPFIFLRGMDADSNFNYCMVKMQLEDKIPPRCVAPSEMKISCSDYKNWKNNGQWNAQKWDELFGTFQYFESCDAETTQKIEEKSQNSCTTEELLRTFTVTELYGAKRSATCTQRIEITGKQDFIVAFPLSKTVACVEPPKETPRVTLSGCENVQITYKDEIFRAATQVFDNQLNKYCYKIVRHWSVINKCRYNPTKYNYLPAGDADVVYTDQLKDTIFYGKYWVDDAGTETNDNALFHLKKEAYMPLKDVTNNAVFANKNDRPYLSFYPNSILGTRKFGAIIDGKSDSTAIQIRDYSGDGVIRYTQIINVIDNENPIFTACPKEMIEAATGDGYDNNCNANAALSITATDKCTPSDSLQYSFVIKLYGKNGEKDLLKGKKKSFMEKLPITKPNDLPHEITWTAQDICGNVATCTYQFRVSDKKMPTVLSRNIYTQVMDKTTVSIPVRKFILSGSDNCSTQDRLHFSFSPDTNDTLKTFTCQDIPTAQVKIYVTDEAKNQTYAAAEINLIDNNIPKNCDPNRDPTIAGKIETENSLAVQANIQLSIENEPYKSERSAAFSWSVPRRKNYFLAPQRTGDWLNGVSTFDLLLIQKHILDIEKLASPYKIIAADANHDGRLTTLDIIELRKNILKISNSFPNNTSWRFIPKNYRFKDAENPLDEQFLEQYRFNSLEKDPISDFVAVKVGDVSDNAYGNFPENRSGIVEERSGKDPMTFWIEDKIIRANERVTVLFKADETRNLAGFEADFQFDNSVLRFEKVVSHRLLVKEGNIGTFGGAITMSWDAVNGVTIAKGEVLFALVFMANKNTRLREVLRTSKNFTQSEAYILEKNVPIIVPLLLQIEENTLLRNENTLHQNTPNPFKNETTLHFYLAEAENVTIRITDATGKNISTIQKYYDKGENELLLQDFPDVGVYFYHLETPTFRATRKMVMVK
jgi:Ig-like domain CHU_C associated/Dockerin type I domain